MLKDFSVSTGKHDTAPRAHYIDSAHHCFGCFGCSIHFSVADPVYELYFSTSRLNAAGLQHPFHAPPLKSRWGTADFEHPFDQPSFETWTRPKLMTGRQHRRD